MAKHLTDNDIEAIVEYLDEWDLSKRVTWERLCIALHDDLGISHTRQTLQKYDRIKGAFDDLKLHLRGKRKRASKVLPSSLAAAAKEIETLNRKNARLERENSELLEQFIVWQYNAHIHGMKIEQLKRPLPEK
ncbi:MAG: hypothetical protein ABNH21_13110 [Glaciecola sp.]|jgi:hypothetical protein